MVARTSLLLLLEKGCPPIRTWNWSLAPMAPGATPSWPGEFYTSTRGPPTCRAGSRETSTRARRRSTHTGWNGTWNRWMPQLTAVPVNSARPSWAAPARALASSASLLNRRVFARGLAGPLPAPGDSSQRSCSDVREKKGNRRRTTLGLLNADAKALCLRPDPELVKVFGIPPHRRSVESPSAWVC